MLVNPKFLVKIPTRSRPHKIFNVLDNVIGNIQTDNYEILISCDVNDNSMCNDVIRNRINEYDKVQVVYGTSVSKVQSINRDIWMVDAWDVLISHSDDMEIISRSFDEWIKEDINRYFKGSTDCILHYLDGTPAKDKLMTWPVIGREYYNRFGYIYHESYKGVYCDNEQGEVAKRLGKYKFISRQLVSHNHPIWLKAEWDELYRRNEESTQYKKDERNYFNRMERNFDL